MVRFIKKYGVKIRLLPAPNPLEDSVTCVKCGLDFNLNTHRRTCYALCGHELCWECMINKVNLKKGCCQCSALMPPPVALPPQKKKATGSQVIVLSSVLSTPSASSRNTSSEENEEEEDEEIEVVDEQKSVEEDNVVFPEIERLSCTELPILERVTELPEIKTEEDTKLFSNIRPIIEDQEGQLVKCPELVDLVEDENQEYPLIDLAEDDEEMEQSENLEREEEMDVEQVCQQNPEENGIAEAEHQVEPEARESIADRHNRLLGGRELTLRLKKLKLVKGKVPRRVLERSLKAFKRLTEKRKPRKCGPNSKNGGIQYKNEVGNFSCVHCPAKFKKRCDMANHYNDVHQALRPFRCPHCNWPFVKQKNLNDHILTHTNERPHKCAHCKSGFNRVFTLRKHLLKIHGINYKTEEKSKLAGTSAPPSVGATGNQPAKRNLKTVFKSGKHGCYHCPAKFRAKSTLAQHLKLEHKDKRPFHCDICNWSFLQKSKLDEHRLTHSKDRPIKCKRCDKTFRQKYSMERHVRIVHLKRPKHFEAAENRPVIRKEAKCKHCPRIFKNRTILGEHLRKEHIDLRPFVCKKCDYPFLKKKHLKEHMKSHSTEQPHECKMCDQKFNRKYSLERHLERRHGVRSKFLAQEILKDPIEYCPECQNIFDGKECVKLAYLQCGHICCAECIVRAELGCGQCTTENAENPQLEEAPESPVKVPSKIFEKQAEQLNDVELNAQERGIDPKIGKMDAIANLEVSSKAISKLKEKESKIFKCKYCKPSQEFDDKKNYVLHLRVEHEDLRPFACKTCDWSFSSHKDLERHKLTHTSDRPYNCGQCPKAFNRKSTMDRHVEKKHGKWQKSRNATIRA